ncbi:MAG: hypothetical protein M3Y59_00650 [Myxococcota bacterium]|nr:hypothetical protein [Myxococcota bacterium]
MAVKRRTSKAPSQESRFTAVLEAIKHQNRSTLEALHGFRESVDRRFDSMEAKFESRFQTLEAAIRDLAGRVTALESAVARNSEDIRQNSADIRQNSADIRKNSEDIQRLREQLAELTGVVRGKAESTELAQLTERVTRLETRLGL